MVGVDAFFIDKEGKWMFRQEKKKEKKKKRKMDNTQTCILSWRALTRDRHVIGSIGTI